MDASGSAMLVWSKYLLLYSCETLGNQIDRSTFCSQIHRKSVFPWAFGNRNDYPLFSSFCFSVQKSGKTSIMTLLKPFTYIRQFCHIYCLSFYRYTFPSVWKEVADLIPKYFSVYLLKKGFSYITPVSLSLWKNLTVIDSLCSLFPIVHPAMPSMAVFLFWN